MLLEVEGLCVNFGHIEAIRDISFGVPEGTITTQGAVDEDPSAGPTVFVWAVTGGTGDYVAAGGEVTGTFRPGTDIVDLEVDLG